MSKAYILSYFLFSTLFQNVKGLSFKLFSFFYLRKFNTYVLVEYFSKHNS